MQKILKILFLISLVLLIMQQLFAWHYNQTIPKERIEALFEPITSKYGIKVVYEIGDDFFSPLENPPVPAGPPRNSKVKPIRHKVLQRYPAILKTVFEKYPAEVIKKHLNAIYFASEIDADGFKAGGTYDPFRRIVYLVDNGASTGTQAMRAFHHEFSSLLIRSHSFFVNPWTDNNPQDFVYLFDTKKDRLQTYNNASLIGTESDYASGFMNTYGQTEFGNDFSEYSAIIFTSPEKFKKIMEQYPRVRGKFLVWLDFYQKVDPIFTEAYLFGSQNAPSTKEHAMADEKS